MNEHRLLLAFFAMQVFTGCANNDTTTSVIPPYKTPTYDARLLVPCSPEYSTLKPDATFDDLVDAHGKDIAQAEECRCRNNALITAVSPKTEVYPCPVIAPAPQAASQPVAPR